MSPTRQGHVCNCEQPVALAATHGESGSSGASICVWPSCMSSWRSVLMPCSSPFLTCMHPNELQAWAGLSESAHSIPCNAPRQQAGPHHELRQQVLAEARQELVEALQLEQAVRLQLAQRDHVLTLRWWAMPPALLRCVSGFPLNSATPAGAAAALGAKTPARAHLPPAAVRCRLGEHPHRLHQVPQEQRKAGHGALQGAEGWMGLGVDRYVAAAHTQRQRQTVVP